MKTEMKVIIVEHKRSGLKPYPGRRQSVVERICAIDSVVSTGKNVCLSNVRFKLV